MGIGHWLVKIMSFYLEGNRRRNNNDNKKVCVWSRVGQNLGRHPHTGGYNIGALSYATILV